MVLNLKSTQQVLSMVDWNTDDFMVEWNSKYVSTNIKAGARPYDEKMFLEMNSQLSVLPELQNCSYAIIVG
jgi:hypothetical protein